MTFTISVYGNTYSEIKESLERLADERLESLSLRKEQLYRFLMIAALPDDDRLGFFDSSQRMIVLSESFADTASFDDISSVFLHELGHALDYFLHGSTSHTPLFRECCASLGLDPEFSKSKVKVNIGRTGGKREKIRKLMALSASSTFENEAAEAIRKAQDMLAQYGEETAPKEKIYEATIYEGQKIPAWTKALGFYLSDTCGVFSLLYKRSDCSAINLYGTLEEVEFALYITTYILEAAEREMRRLRRNGERVTRSTFLYASVQALREKTYDRGSTTALVMVDERERNTELTKRLVFGDKGTIKYRRMQSSISDYSSFRKGQDFGNSLEVDRARGQKLID